MAQRKATTVSYIHQDHLTGTSVTSDASGAQSSTIKYYPYGQTRSTSGTIPTDKRFTGQRLDGTGLYYYGARYYDPYIGRFISADTIVPNPANPQSLNRYSYCLNNPLRYIDPFGYFQISWGSSGGLFNYPADEAFLPGGYYASGMGDGPIAYNSDTTLYGPPAQPGQATVAWVQEAIARGASDTVLKNVPGVELKSVSSETSIADVSAAAGGASVVIPVGRDTAIGIPSPPAPGQPTGSIGAQVVSTALSWSPNVTLEPGWVPSGNAAWTLPGLILFKGSFDSLTVGLTAHEAVHVVQWHTYGFWGFIWNYLTDPTGMESPAYAVYTPGQEKFFTVALIAPK